MPSIGNVYVATFDRLSHEWELFVLVDEHECGLFLKADPQVLVVTP